MLKGGLQNVNKKIMKAGKVKEKRFHKDAITVCF